jgi:hypothetical protein
MNELGSNASGTVFGVTENGNEPSRISETTKKEFVEPEVSSPEDVLQCTTFFQLADSGATT